MVFSSLIFTGIFLPAVWLIQLCLPSVRGKNTALLAASIFFYAYGEPVYVICLIVSAVMNWVFGLLIAGGMRRRPFCLAAAVILNLSFLTVFKYAGFLVRSVNVLLHLTLPVPEIALPVGISFYTFQAMSYVIDVYRGDCEAERNLFDLMLYISFFPQLIAGPILRYRDIAAQIRGRRITAEDSAAGIRRFLFGLGKKVLIADTCGVIADTLFQAPPEQIFFPSAWLAAFSFLIQIYFDFSGYSDMAIGMGRMFGFHFRENFLRPYTACSITDFWRRWHISLSAWFREYLYIPLGGNRKGRVRTVFNKFVVFLTCGIWHGANVTYLFWGFYHGCLLMLESLLCTGSGKQKQDIPSSAHVPAGRVKKAVLHLYTLLAVMIGFVFFRAETLRQGFDMVRRMIPVFPASCPEANVLLRSVLTPPGIAALCAGMCSCIPIRCPAGGRRYQAVLSAASLVLLAVCILNLAGGSYHPFLYFRF